MAGQHVALLLLGIVLLCSFGCLVRGDTSGSVHRNCELSLRDSEGWFCQPDMIWSARKDIALRQFARNDGYGLKDRYDDYFQANWEPELHCTFMERIGKWVCDPMRTASHSSPCLVYSIGSCNNFGFENDLLKQLPHCEVHTFDHTSNPPQANDNQAIKFHKLGLSGKDAPPMASLPTILASLNHTGKEITLFKIDIEGAEFEVHFPNNPIAGSTTKYGAIDTLMRNLHNAGFAIFSKARPAA
ncbi:methyltranfer_dom domain-containing protein [Haematococcus lacustris]|uniref:Methyltranfer_dom domain-containing protein n=1 Tax=Haematococcus lacustris TaxID=44745 RepID=A0A699ZR97_HAELA|nr:methyltranfer_dom domain-containing protein [Haematococcus lacustris]